jgi:hypothetical protein
MKPKSFPKLPMALKSLPSKPCLALDVRVRGCFHRSLDKEALDISRRRWHHRTCIKRGAGSPRQPAATGQGGFPQGDAAEIGNETVAREAGPPTGGLFYVCEDSELPTSEEEARADEG